MSTGISRPVRCISATILSVIFYASLQLQNGHAFQTINRFHPPLQLQRTRLQLQENNADLTSDLDRRAFLDRSLAASSIVFLSLICTTQKDVAFAMSDDAMSDDDDNDIQLLPEQLVTTPSISEGELTVSEPPPMRTKEVVTPQKEQKKKSADPRFFIAGGASAAISHGITTPLDVVKTRMQSEAALANVSPSEAALKIIEEEGPKALTVGLGPTVIGYGIEGALKFGVYESLKPIFLSALSEGVSSHSEAYLAAAVCAGALASIILCPMEETRIRLVTDPTFGKGLLDGLPKLLKEEGVLTPFQKGLAPMLSKQVPYTMGKQVSFDLFAGMLYTLLIGLSWVPQKEIALEVEIGAAFLASIVACLASHPGDVLLTATYNNRDATSPGFGDTIKRVYEEGGASAFFRGLNARFLHVGCIITFQLVIYDQIKQGLGLPASGS